MMMKTNNNIKFRRRRAKAIPLLLTLYVIATYTQAATYYMTVSDASFLTSGPYTKDQYSIDLQVTYSAPSGISATNCRGRVSSLPSGWAVLDNYNTNYKTLSACSGTTTFELMPTTTGTFSGSDIVIEISGMDSSGENTLSPGTKSPSGTLTVESQPILDLTIVNMSSTTNISVNDTISVEYQVTNTGSTGTADTSNLRLTIASTPFNSVVFASNNLTSIVVGSGTLPAGEKTTGTVLVRVSSTTTSNTPTFTITAAADNTAHKSSSSSSSIQCTNCLQALAINLVLSSGWNLISLPMSV